MAEQITSEQRETRRLAMRKRALNDFWFFQTQVLKNVFLEESLHKPLSEWLQAPSEKPKKLELVARGHVKSNMVTIAYPLWRACKNVNIRILLGSHKDPDALKFLRTIKRIIKKNVTFRWLFPEVRPQMEGGREELWNERQALITRDSTATEATFEVTSLKSEVTGRHYGLMILDDIVTAKNVQNSDQITETMEFHQRCESLLDPGAEEIDVGTRYDFGDEYARILEDKDLMELYEVRVLPAHKHDILHDFLPGGAKHGKWTREDDYKHLIHPKRFTLDSRDYKDPRGREHLHRKSLPATYLFQGPTVYATQYMLEPMDPSTAIFKEKDIRIVRKLPDGPLKWYRFCDLSSDDPNKESYTAIITGCVDQYGLFTVTHIFWKNCLPSKTVDELIRGQNVPEEVRPIRISFENGPYEKAIRPWLKRQAREEETHIPLKFLPGSFTQKVKDTRITGLEPYVASGEIQILDSCPHKKELIEELVRFPKFKRKDIIDALAHVPVIVYAGRKRESIEPDNGEIDWEEVKEGIRQMRVTEAMNRGKPNQPIGSRNRMSSVGRQAFHAVRFGRG